MAQTAADRGANDPRRTIADMTVSFLSASRATRLRSCPRAQGHADGLAIASTPGRVVVRREPTFGSPWVDLDGRSSSTHPRRDVNTILKKGACASTLPAKSRLGTGVRPRRFPPAPTGRSLRQQRIKGHAPPLMNRRRLTGRAPLNCSIKGEPGTGENPTRPQGDPTVGNPPRRFAGRQARRYL